MANPRLGLGNISLTPFAVFGVKTEQIALPLLTQQKLWTIKKENPISSNKGNRQEDRGWRGCCLALEARH